MALSNLGLPKLENYITLAEAAEVLGMSRQGVSLLVQNGKIKSARQVGNRDVFVVDVEEVASMAFRREMDRNRASAEEEDPRIP